MMRYAMVGLALLALGCGASPSEQSSGLDLEALDRTADPCADFYQLACGGWVASHPVNADASYAAKFYDPYYASLPGLRQIMEDDAAGVSSADDPHGALIGAYYQSCLDAPASNTARDALRTRLSAIDAIASLDDLARQVAVQRSLGSGAFFHAYVSPDPGEATHYLVVLDQGGFELPDRSYYLDADHQALLVDYQAHIEALSALIGGTPIDAAAAIRVEKALAQASLPDEERRDPVSLYHPMKVDEAAAFAPSFPLSSFWSQAGLPAGARVDVTSPAYFQALEAIFTGTPLDDLKSYLRWQLVQDRASELDQAVLDEDLHFWSSLTGQQSLPPRWFTCFNATLGALGTAVALPYLARHFDEAAATTTEAMFDRARGSLDRRLQGASWLDAPTRAEALAKLAAIVPKIGHPSSGPDLAGLVLDRGSYLDNLIHLRQRGFEKSAARVGAVVDRSEWNLSPLTVNASYSATANDVTLPAALLASPFLSTSALPAVNFGALGSVLGHEMTHGFDDQGRRFDGDGSLRDWWTPAVAASFEARAACVADQFDAFEPLPGEHVDGTLTLGENIADLGGLDLAYGALFDGSEEVQGGDGFSAQQVFFLAYAQTHCENVRPDLQSLWLVSEPHSPGKLRVNGPLANLPAFRAAFGCFAPGPMAREEVCKVW
jgi:predicted metalloendopeptidase